MPLCGCFPRGRMDPMSCPIHSRRSVMPWMPAPLAKFFTYWSLTLAVFFIYLFAMLVAGLDVWDDLMDRVRKRRAEQPGVDELAASPLAGKSVASTLGIGPGQF